MFETIRDTLRKHFVLSIALIGLLPVGVVSVTSLIIPFNREVVYDMHNVLSKCFASGTKAGRTCVGRVELIIGNSGHREETVRLAWPRFEGRWQRDQRVMDISADRPRSHNPAIDCAVAGGRQECTIDQFAPGALVFMTLDCYLCSEREIELLGATPLEIRTEAHVSTGDPRVTLLLRRLLGLARFFM